MDCFKGINLYQYQHTELCIDPKFIKYFTAKVIDLIERIHNKGVVYRDLKLENIMIQKHSASIHLVDFGFSKVLKRNKRAYTKCGTPGYTAPEILK